jgi:hypothetical protein
MPDSIEKIILRVSADIDAINRLSPTSAKITMCCSCSPMFDLRQPDNIRKSILQHISVLAASHNSPDVVLVELAAGQLLQSALNLETFLQYLPAIDKIKSFKIVLSETDEFDDALKKNWLKFVEILNQKHQIEIQTVFFKGSLERVEPSITFENESKLSDDAIKKRIDSGKEIVVVNMGTYTKIFYDMGHVPAPAEDEVKSGGDWGDEDDLDDSHLAKHYEVQMGVLEVKTVELPINEQNKREAILELVQRNEFHNYKGVRFHSLFNKLSRVCENVSLVTLVDLDLDYSFFTGLNPQRLAVALKNSNLCGPSGVFLYADKMREPEKIGGKPSRAEIIEFQVFPSPMLCRSVAEFAEQGDRCRLVISQLRVKHG